MYMYVHMDSYMYNIIVKGIRNACIVQLVCTRDMYTVHNKSLIIDDICAAYREIPLRCTTT